MMTLRQLAGLLGGLSVACGSLACGDKLSAIGGGVRFERIHASRHAGRIALYVPRDSRLRVANEELRLADALTRVGHTVEIVDAPDALQRTLQGAAVDVVLADVADAGALEANVGAATAPTILPVAYAPGGDAADRPARCVTRLTRRSNQQLVRAVDDVLERRSRGSPPLCRVALNARGI